MECVIETQASVILQSVLRRHVGGLYFNMPHCMYSYFAAQIHKIQSSGLDPGTPAAQVAAIQRSQQLTKTPSSIWPTPSRSPSPSALSLLSSPLPSSAVKPLSNAPPLPQS